MKENILLILIGLVVFIYGADISIPGNHSKKLEQIYGILTMAIGIWIIIITLWK